MMNRYLLCFSLVFIAGTLLAQPVSKKGEFYLPEEGDIGLSVDASPFLDYIGNFFSDSENSSPSAEFANNDFAIMVKKFKDAETAYRASVRVNVLNESYRAFSPEFSQEPTNTTVEDKYSRTFTNAYLSLGLEKRKGNTRIQGFYGVEGIIGFGTENHTFEYGNDITPENTDPVRNEFEIIFQDDPREVTNLNENGSFVTEFKKGTTFSIGARAFIGAEIFLFPKWSVGFEYGFSAAFAYTGNSSITSEQFTIPTGGSTEQFVTTVDDEGGSSQLRIDNDNSGGAFFMSFYF